jgi:2-phosphosulfolactate phosphatase
MIRPSLEVCFSPSLLPLFNTTDTITVVIDVFRATSTIIAALHNGAHSVIPVSSVKECIQIGRDLPNSITAGERDGKVADGLNYGNSPSEYPKSFVEGKILVLTTTNGTRLLHMIQNAHSIVIGSFSNLNAISEFLIKQNRNVLLACASWKDRFNLEDSLFAGAVANSIINNFTINCDSAHACMSMSDQAQGDYYEYLKRGAHFKRLSGYGLESDMIDCTSVNTHPIVPILKGDSLVIYDSN